MKASGLVLGDSSKEEKVEMTSRWKPAADRRVRVALKGFAVVAPAAVRGGADGSFSFFITPIFNPPILAI